MSNPIKLAFNRQTQQLVNYNGSAAAIPDLFQGNIRDFQIQIVDSPTALNQAFVVVDMAGSGLRLWLGPTPTGTAGGPAQYALQDVWTWDAVNKWFTASLALNVTPVDTALGTASSIQATIEVTITGAGRQTLYQSAVTLKAVGDEATTTAPGPVDQYYTRAEINALFAKLVNDPGVRMIFKSPDGTKIRELGVDNDGSAVDNSG